ncbi:MAG: PqqD family protein [Rhodospirillales bacterium]|nr:PqqD family protein [Anaerolinea sp.]
MPDDETELPERAGLVVREVGDELLVLDTEGDLVHRLNPSATLIWRWSSAGASIQEIVKKLATMFEVSAETAKRDAEEMVTRLRELSLIR